MAEHPVDLSPISAAIHHGCMGLPQELIDYIMDMLHDDIRALKACSLTCKAMFASSRHLVHQRLCLTVRNNQRVLTREEKSRHREGDHRDMDLRFLSFMGEHGFLQYTRRVYIRDPIRFNPDTLLPHMSHFKSLDRVHTLTFEGFDAISWANHHQTCFAHFYPTLTSLTLSRPHSQYRDLVEFILQFPNLQNLCLEWLRAGDQTQPDPSVPIIVDQFPPFRGHLRLAFGAEIGWLADFARDFRNRIRFRSVEIEADFFGDGVQYYILHLCACALRNLTISFPGLGTYRSSFLSLHVAE